MTKIISKLWISILLIMAGIIVFAGPVHTQEKPDENTGIARLDSFSGTILLKNQSKWGVSPIKGMILYHGDKVVTQNDGVCKVIFNDGAVLDVQPNSNIRIHEVTDEDKVNVTRRDVTVLIGKVKYKSSENSKTETSMVAPTAVAALRGTEVEFGTDGDIAFLNRIAGKTDNNGNISEGYVPEATSEQAVKNSNYTACLEAQQLQIEANKLAQELAEVPGKKAISMADSSVLIASNSLWRDILLLANLAQSSIPIPESKAFDLEKAQKQADAYLAQSKASKASIAANLSEANAFMNTPSSHVMSRSKNAIIAANKAIENAEKVVQACVNTAKQIETLIKQIEKGEQKQEAKEALQKILGADMKAQQTLMMSAITQEAVSNKIVSGTPNNTAQLVNQMANVADNAMLKANETLQKMVDIAQKVEQINDKTMTKEQQQQVLQVYSKSADIEAKAIEVNAAVVKSADNVIAAAGTNKPSAAKTAFDDLQTTEKAANKMEQTVKDAGQVVKVVEAAVANNTATTSSLTKNVQSMDNLDKQAAQTIISIPLVLLPKVISTTPATTPVTTAATTPATTPVTTAETTPVTTADTTPATTPVTTADTTAVTTPATTPDTTAATTPPTTPDTMATSTPVTMPASPTQNMDQIKEIQQQTQQNMTTTTIAPYGQ